MLCLTLERQLIVIRCTSGQLHHVPMELFNPLGRKRPALVIELNSHGVDDEDSADLLLQALNLRLSQALMQEEREEETTWRLNFMRASTNYIGESKGRQRPRLFLQGRLYRIRCGCLSRRLLVPVCHHCVLSVGTRLPFQRAEKTARTHTASICEAS